MLALSSFPPLPLPSFPRKRESRKSRLAVCLSLAVPFWIPAYAGMTVGGLGMTVERTGMTV